ncbi:MAG TPA: TonB-dependent receptor, partial [Longimicrobiales bacterium]|nr:TonB-dependent receptor [Longimicrobiales bacterium]
MQGSTKGALGSFALSLAVLALALPAAAQTTGKIEGRVRDAQSGQPLAGAQVVVDGTTLGNISNADGYYFINNVPAGLHDVRAQFIGYQTVTVTGQRVLAGQTMTVSFELQPSAVEIAGIEVVGESNPLLPRDKTVSKAIITGDVVNELPVDNVRDVVTLQPGVVDYGSFQGVVIRGGRPGEASVYVDGVLVRSFNRGAQSILEVGTNGVEEVNVLLGGYGAEYGQAQSGIINYITKGGTQSLSGAVSFWTDEMMPNDVSFGESRLEASVSGPITENSSFHLSLTGQGAEDAVPTFMDADKIFNTAQLGGERVILPVQTRWFRPVADATGAHAAIRDADGNVIGHEYEPMEDLGNRTPWSNQDLYTLGGSIRFSPFDNTRVSLSHNRSRNHGLSFNEDFQFR